MSKKIFFQISTENFAFYYLFIIFSNFSSISISYKICKPIVNANRSLSSKQRMPQKCYKHIALFSLNNITKVCNIIQYKDDTDLFGIHCRLAGENDKFLSFKVIATDSAYDLVNSLTVVGFNSMTLNSTSSFNHSISTVNSPPNSLYASSTNLNYTEEPSQAQVEKKEYIRLLTQGICNVKCFTEYVSYTNALVSHETRFFYFF